MNFKIGQVFEESYPPEAADWCNTNNAHIEQIEDGNVIRRYKIVADPPPPEQTYIDKRRAEYPPVGEQLDMLYHDRLDGTNTWVQAIKRVKEMYPKGRMETE